MSHSAHSWMPMSLVKWNLNIMGKMSRVKWNLEMAVGRLLKMTSKPNRVEMLKRKAARRRDDGSGYRNKTFQLDLCEPPGCGCELCDIVARLAIWFIRLVDPNAHDDAVELEFIPISNLVLAGYMVLLIYDFTPSPDCQSCRLLRLLQYLAGHLAIIHHPLLTSSGNS